MHMIEQRFGPFEDLLQMGLKHDQRDIYNISDISKLVINYTDSMLHASVFIYINDIIIQITNMLDNVRHSS